MILVVILLLVLIIIGLQSRIYRRFWLTGLDVRLHFSQTTGVEGQMCQLEETITSKKLLPLPWLTVKFQVSRHLLFPDKLHAKVSDDYYREDLFSISMYQKIRRRLDIRLDRRGFYRIKSIDVISSDLLMQKRLIGHFTSQSNITVTPRLLPRHDLEIPYRQLVGSAITQHSLLADPFEFRTIREYQPFDNLKTINWKATARTGQIRVNVHEYTTTREIRLLLNVEPDFTFFDEFLTEEAIRIVATAADMAGDDSIALSLISNGRDTLTCDRADVPAGQSRQHVQRIQEQLGRIDLKQKPERFADILDSMPPPGFNEPVLLMVSLNCNDQMVDSWHNLLSRGFSGIWIVPQIKGHTIRVPETDQPVFIWEADVND